ncbi:hypothetical protein CEXT_341481 [Caerostris extrusa]|uniref:Uncharacterized protein n=1 Tax=Caerostris extrusa TaxID=172846 RepID=A0AAV4NEC2_CAEEX|nr:hypothetical protein CEXT_341481 [Caerostris extrusa]
MKSFTLWGLHLTEDHFEKTVLWREEFARRRFSSSLVPTPVLRRIKNDSGVFEGSSRKIRDESFPLRTPYFHDSPRSGCRFANVFENKTEMKKIIKSRKNNLKETRVSTAGWGLRRCFQTWMTTLIRGHSNSMQSIQRSPVSLTSQLRQHAVHSAFSSELNEAVPTFHFTDYE